MSPLDSIRAQGDDLERGIFRDGQFADWFANYALIWSWLQLVGAGGRDDASVWDAFARSHYAAVERTWAAWRQHQRMHVVGRVPTTVLALSAAGLWVHANSAMSMLDAAARDLDQRILRSEQVQRMAAAVRWEVARDLVDPRSGDVREAEACWTLFLSCAQEGWNDLVHRCSPFLRPS